ncbi:MAG: LPS assembly lipoprotein LptE [Gammaproteobacteria bacterium]|nr:LPS assembly lipoprotein LptE [Gammaproteobacteria bacterium]
MKKINFIVFFLAASILSGCGFHLRGSQDLSAVLPEVQLSGVNQHSELGRDLIRALTNSKVTVVDESSMVLTVRKNSTTKRVLSVDSAGRANQYELNYQLGFTLQKKMQAEDDKQKLVDLVAPQTISEKREYLFDANLLLAKTAEETKLNNEMRQAAILQLLRRLMFSLKSKDKTNSAVK